MCVCVRVCACARVRVCACARACVRAIVYVYMLDMVDIIQLEGFVAIQFDSVKTYCPYHFMLLRFTHVARKNMVIYIQ